MNSAVPRPLAVKSAVRTLDLIELVVARREGMAASDIAAALGIPVSSLSYLLTTLCEREYLVREGRAYLPGPGLNRLRLPEAWLSLEQRMAPAVRGLRQELNETAALLVREGWNAVVVMTEAGDHALRYAVAAGESRPLHSLAGGKVLLAALSPEELDHYFAVAPRERRTDRTIVDEAALRAELDRARATGFAEAHEESTPGICSLARPVEIGGTTVAALGVAIPTVRFTAGLRDRAMAALGRF